MITRRTVLSSALAAGALGVATGAAHAAAPRIFASHGLAIRGADPVGYFDESEAVAGSVANGLIWRGATWLFASEESRARFESNPRGFAPRYGGYCAWAIAQGYLAPSDPAAWVIHGGRLYLTFSKMARKRFVADIEASIAQADANWPDVLRQ